MPQRPEAGPVRLRRARAEDRDRLLAWRNDPSTRRWYLDPSRVSRDDHQRWFAARLADEDSRLYVAEQRSVPIGQVRIERTPRGAEVSFSVAADARGRGLGPQMLTGAARRATRELGASSVFAYVLPANVPS